MSHNDTLDKIKLVIFVYIMAILLCACTDQSKDTSTSPSSLDNLITPTPKTPVTSEPTTPGSPNQNISGNQFPTTNGGMISLTKIMNFNLTQGSNVIMIKADSTALFFYMQNTLSGGIYYRAINRFDLITSTWSTVCNILDDGTFGQGFEIDDSYYYIFNLKQNYYTDKIRRFSRQSCAEVGSINIPQSIYNNSYYNLPLSKDSDGQFSWVNNSSNFKFNPTNSLLSSWSLNGSVGGETFSLNSTTQTRNGLTWSLNSGSGYNSTLLWKYISITNTFAWTKIYYNGALYSDLDWDGSYAKPLVIPTAGNKLYITKLSDGYGSSLLSINIYQFDVSGF